MEVLKLVALKILCNNLILIFQNYFRDSKSNILKWREKLTWTRVKTIQDRCTKAMATLGYNKLNRIQQNNFVSPSIPKHTWPFTNT